jgi:gliding motility-associated-like protein
MINGGGSTTTTVNITVVNTVVPTFVNVNNNSICIGDTIKYITQPGYYNYSWNIAGSLNVDYKIVSGGISSTDNQVTLQWLTSGNKTVSVNYADANGFTGTIAAVVTNTINGLPSGTIVASQGTILCSGSNLPLSVNGGVSYAWQLNGVGISGGANGQLSANTVGVYSVLITDANGCSNTASNMVTLTGISAPVASYIVNSYCVNQPLQVTNISQTMNSGMVSYTWSDNLGNTSSNSVPSFMYSQAGNVQLQLTVTPQLCPQLANTVVQNIEVAVPQVGIRMSPVNVIAGSNTNLNARQLNNVSGYNWVPSTGLSNASVSNPTVNISQEQLYYININTASGCVTTDTLLVRVFAGWDIFVPNVFSPNGDGINDILNVNLVGVKSLHYFRIYNRWSKKVFETSDAGQGWDGRVNGVLQPMATYVWIAEGIDNNGQTVRKEGSVTLLR